MNNIIQRIVNLITFMTFPRRLRNFCRRHPKGFLAYWVSIMTINYFTWERQFNWWTRSFEKIERRLSPDHKSFMEDYKVQSFVPEDHEPW